jgi:hypothetical protein
MLEAYDINFEDPDVKSQLMSVVPFIKMEKPREMVEVMQRKLQPELFTAVLKLVRQLHSFLGDLLKELDNSDVNDDFSDLL